MTTAKYKYNKGDFTPLPVSLEHLDIHLNFIDEKVDVESTLRMTARVELDTITFDARDLTIRSVEWVGKPEGTLAYEHRKAENELMMGLPTTMQAGATFSVRARTTCTPSDRVMEGIYKDTTPEDCPQQYISQCQQWGFQRIAPILDNCTAKCTMTTTIEADARYSHLISNGDISKTRNPDGRPVPKPGDPSRQIITYENRFPMVPYLFVVCVGTWDMLTDEVTLPSGKTIRLEYLVPPGRKAGAAIPMQILKESVLWQNRTQNYEYKWDVYRTICMERSNFGGMENTGNTTIVTDSALIDEYTSDGRLEYAHGVIVHEFEHNQCGSDVTMETPFDMWLNEAFTVDVERQFLTTIFDPAYVRLGTVDAVRSPVHGPLAIEDAGRLGNIVRQGFNDPDELIDSVTYVKAAEVIRMLRLLLGDDVFRQAKDLYFKRHSGGNANTDQFLLCFEEISGKDLSQFKREWLSTIGYPIIEARHHYDQDSRRLDVKLSQSRAGKGGPFHLPLELAAVDENGEDIPGTARTVQITGKETDVVIEDLACAPAFVSYNRDCSFYGTFRNSSATVKSLTLQAKQDPNHFNRVEAMRQLTDRERIGLVENIEGSVSSQWLEVFAAAIQDDSLPPGLKAYLLRIDEQPLDRAYATSYRELYAARLKLLNSVAAGCMDKLLDIYGATDTCSKGISPRDGIEERYLKAVLLRLITAADTPETHQLAEEHFWKAWNITDRLSALRCINLSKHPSRRVLMTEGHELWHGHLSAYSGYLQVVSFGVHDDVFEMIADEERRASFDIKHPTLSRALYLPFGSNNKMLWTDRGIGWVADTVTKLAPINEMAAGRLVASFRQVHKLADDLKSKVLAALERMRTEISEETAPSVAGRIRSYLEVR